MPDGPATTVEAIVPSARDRIRGFFGKGKASQPPPAATPIATSTVVQEPQPQRQEGNFMTTKPGNVEGGVAVVDKGPTSLPQKMVDAARAELEGNTDEAVPPVIRETSAEASARIAQLMRDARANITPTETPTPSPVVEATVAPVIEETPVAVPVVVEPVVAEAAAPEAVASTEVVSTPITEPSAVVAETPTPSPVVEATVASVPAETSAEASARISQLMRDARANITPTETPTEASAADVPVSEVASPVEPISSPVSRTEKRRINAAAKKVRSAEKKEKQKLERAEKVPMKAEEPAVPTEGDAPVVVESSTEDASSEAGREVTIPNGTDLYFGSVQAEEAMSTALVKYTGEVPSKEQVESLLKRVRNKISKVKVLGQPLPDFIAGAVLGAGSKQLASMGLSIAGMGGLPFTLGVGAAAGVIAGTFREYLKQRHTINKEHSEELSEIRGNFKREFARMKLADRKKLGKAAFKGAIAGALGGVVGGVIVEHWSDIIHYVPGMGSAETAIAPTPGASEAAASVTSSPTPSADTLTHPPVTAEAPTVAGEVAPESPLDSSPEDIVSSALPKEIELPAGSNPWAEVDKYLADKLGRPPTNIEISDSVERLLSDNEITDATKITAGTNLSMDGVNKHIGEILAGHSLIPPDIAALPSVSLPAGSNPWNEVSSLLSDQFGKPPTNLEILSVARELCIQSKIAVPEWGVPGDFDVKNLPSGFMLIFNDEVKRKIADIVA